MTMRALRIHNLFQAFLQHQLPPVTMKAMNPPTDMLVDIQRRGALPEPAPFLCNMSVHFLKNINGFFAPPTVSLPAICHLFYFVSFLLFKNRLKRMETLLSWALYSWTSLVAIWQLFHFLYHGAQIHTFCNVVLILLWIHLDKHQTLLRTTS